MKVFIQKAAQYGAKVFSDKGKHLKFRDSLGHQISSPKTTSDFRAIRNFESELKRRGFVDQSKAARVKDSLVKSTKVTVLPASRRSANQQTTFSDFTRKYQPNVQGPKRSELQVQGDHIINTIRAKAKRKTISRAQLDSMKIPQREKDKLIKQGLVTENKFRVAAQLMRKAGVRNYDDLTRTVNTIKQQVGDKIIQSLRTPKQPTKKGLELQRRMSRAVDKNKDKYPGLFDEQMVVPRSIKKKNPLMTVKTEMEILKQLSNRKAAYDAARTGKAMYPFSEENKHREDKLNYQYKEVTNPKKPVDVIKALKLKKA